VILSTHNNDNFWLNPPRENTDDKPLEFEWFTYFDAPSEWGWADHLGDLSMVNWSAFWM
jgi:hypothetical protein